MIAPKHNTNWSNLLRSGAFEIKYKSFESFLCSTNTFTKFFLLIH